MNLHQLLEDLGDLILTGVTVIIESVNDQWRIELRSETAHVSRLCALDDLAGSLESAIAALDSITKSKTIGGVK